MDSMDPLGMNQDMIRYASNWVGLPNGIDMMDDGLSLDDVSS